METTYDTFYAKTALILSLGFWIPLFNIGLTLVSIYLALKALRLVEENPKKFGGRKQAIAALVISAATLAATIAGTILYGMRTYC